MSNKKFDHLVEELESQFHSIQNKLAKARDSYVAKYEKDFNKAKSKVEAITAKLSAEKKRYSDAVVAAKVSGTKKAANQLKKAKAAMSVVASSLTEAKTIMSTVEEKLNSAKPFDKKLAAREKALKEFEKAWEKKAKEDAATKAKQEAEKAKQNKVKAAAKAKVKAKTTAKVKTKAKAKASPARKTPAGKPAAQSMALPAAQDDEQAKVSAPQASESSVTPSDRGDV